MKKFALLAVLAGISAAASAQSSVTLFGILDEAARYAKSDAGHVKELASGGINTSRFGVRGVEDLGGGLKAGFWLEAGINANSGYTNEGAGSANRFFSRRTTVSLISDTIGELRVGRDYTTTYLGYTDYDAFGDVGVAGSSKFDSNLGSNRATGTRSDNQVMYITPSNLGGFYGRASVAATTGSGAGAGSLNSAIAGQKYYSGRAGYAAGPLDISATYGMTYVNAATAGQPGAHIFRVAEGGAAYDFGVAKVQGYYTQSKFADQKIAVYSLAGIVPIGLGQLKAEYTHANQSGTAAAIQAGAGSSSTTTSGGGVIAAGNSVNSNDANQYALGYVYNLSKRTAVYGTAAIVRNKGQAAFAVAGSPNVTPGGKSEGAEVGIRHAF